MAQAQAKTHALVHSQPPSNTPQSNSIGKSGFRKAFKKWKDKLRTSAPAPAAAPVSASRPTSQSRATSVDPAPAPTPTPPQSQPSAPQPQSKTRSTSTPTSIIACHNPSQHAAQFFQPTTQTTIHSPADPRNRSKSPPPSTSLNGASHALSRRISAPADYFSANRAQGTTLTTGTITTITGSSMHKRRSSRLRLSFAKRNSTAVQPVQPVKSTQSVPPVTASPPSSAPSTAAVTPISPTPSAPNPIGHEAKNNTFQYTTVADIAARMQSVDEELGDAAEVIKRDRPKDWLDPGWREREEKERERILEEKRREEDEKERLEKEENERMGSAIMTGAKDGEGGEGGPGVLRKWEWGK